MKIVIDDKIPFIKGVFEPQAEVIYSTGTAISADMVRDADALITRTRTKCNSALLEGSSVKMIATATIGFDHIATPYCANNGIEWTNAPGCNSGSVQQYLSAILSLLVLEKGWQLKHKSIAIVGVGNVGSKVSTLAKAFGLKVYEIDPPRARNEKGKLFYKLQEVISKVDIITFHTPLTQTGEDNTFHLCNESLLRQLKPEAVVINTSRGEVIDGLALKNALINKSIGSAVIDVWENEPNIDLDLLNSVWIATPHIAGYSQDGKALGTQMSVRAISKCFNMGLDSWTPTGMPSPQEPELNINCSGLSDEEILAQACYHTYDIQQDDARLREHTDTFEKQRGDYPVRREFIAYKIALKHGKPHQKELLQSIGFNNVIMI